MTQKTNRKWNIYHNKLVRVLNKDVNLIVYGVLIETKQDVSRFLPYTSYAGLFGEDRTYKWVNDGLPRSVKEEDISQMECVDKEYIDFMIEEGQKINKTIEDKKKIEGLELKLRLSELGKVKELKD